MKNFIPKILTAALILSIAAGTGIGAAAAETDRQIQPLTAAVELSKYDTTKQIADKILQNISDRIPGQDTFQNIKTIAQLLKDKYKKYSLKQGKLYLTEGDFTYLVHLSLKKGGSFAELITYSGDNTEITVPAFADNIPVTKIFSFGEHDEDYRYSVTTLNVPATVKEISAADVFDLFGLQTINIDPSNPYITSVDGVAFSKDMTQLLALPPARTAYTIPDTVTEIAAFSCYASALEEIHFPNNLNTIGQYAFFASPKLKSVKLPASTAEIGDYAFAHCVNLEQAVIPLTVENISSNAFEAVAEQFVIFSADTIQKGETITITIPQKENCTYAVYYKKSSDKIWVPKQLFSQNNIITVKPVRTGNYQVCVKIKDENGSVSKNYLNLTVQPKA